MWLFVDFAIFSSTHVSVVVVGVVGQFEFVEGDDLLHPVGPQCWAVWMHVDPRRCVGVGLPRHYPTGAANNAEMENEISCS